MRDLLVTFGLVFLAELGDQSMLLAIGFAARYWPWPVLGGIAIAAFTMLWLSTRAGRRSASRCRTGARDRRRAAVPQLRALDAARRR
jgi:putative Ca2+/H+ antiporter (TMEM165/GDT1 family)